jgi:hypothetical protein
MLCEVIRQQRADGQRIDVIACMRAKHGSVARPPASGSDVAVRRCDQVMEMSPEPSRRRVVQHRIDEIRRMELRSQAGKVEATASDQAGVGGGMGMRRSRSIGENVGETEIVRRKPVRQRMAATDDAAEGSVCRRHHRCRCRRRRVCSNGRGGEGGRIRLRHIGSGRRDVACVKLSDVSDRSAAGSR